MLWEHVQASLDMVTLFAHLIVSCHPIKLEDAGNLILHLESNRGKGSLTK